MGNDVSPFSVFFFFFSGHFSGETPPFCTGNSLLGSMDPLVPMGQGNLQQLSGTLDRSHPKKRNESPFTTIQGSFSLIAPIYIYIFFFLLLPSFKKLTFWPSDFFCDQGAPGFENSFVGKSHNASKRNTFPRRNFLACGKKHPSPKINRHL